MSRSQSSMSFPKWPRRSKDEDKRLKREIEKHQAMYGKDFLGAPVEIVMKLDAAVLNRLPPQVLQGLPREGLKRLHGDVLATLPPNTLLQLDLEDMRRLPLDTLERFPPIYLAKLAHAAPGFLSKLSTEKLGEVLPQLDVDDLSMVPRNSIASVNPLHLAQISQQGLASLARRFPDLYHLFLNLSHANLFRLPPHILEKLPADSFKHIPPDEWSNQPEELLMNLPPDIRKLIPKDVRGQASNQNESVPPESSEESQQSLSPPTTPSFPVDFSQDGSLTPKVAPQVGSPAVQPRTHKQPPLAYENQTTVKRTNSFSSRLRAPSPSQDFRTPAIRYFQDAPPLPERRSSRSTNQGEDPRDLSSYGSAPPPSDFKSRSEIFSDHHGTEELKKDLVAKTKRIEELDVQMKNRENWWKQERDRLDDKVVNLTVGMKTSTDRIFNSLSGMAPNSYWDRSNPDPTAVLISFAEGLNSSLQWSSSQLFDCLERSTQLSWDRSQDPTQPIITLTDELVAWKVSSTDYIFDCLQRVAPDKPWDRSQMDPASAIVGHMEEVCKAAKENFDAATTCRINALREEKKNDDLERELDKKAKEFRALNDDLVTLRFNHEQCSQLLSKADTAKSNYERSYMVLKQERDRLALQVQELQKRIDTELSVARANIAHQKTYYEAQAAGIKQQNIDLQAQLIQQKEGLAQEIQKQHSYYEDRRKKQEEAIKQADQKREQDLKSQELQFTQERQKIHSHYDEQLKKEREKLQKERQDHELALKHHAVNLQEKIKSLESDLVDNSDDFRPATDDSLKMSYGKLKLMVETVTEPFNLGTVTVPHGFDSDNFLAREGKGQTRVLLRTIVWTKIMDGFFSSPLGFGSFGPTHGKKLLLDTYLAWRKLFGEDPISVSGFCMPEEVLERFRTDKEANKWRSATFQSILMAVAPRGQKKNQATNGHLVKPFADNRQKVHDQILGVLAQVCNDQVEPEIAEKIVEIVQLAGELALEFGSQRAELALDRPAKGDTITIGPEFIDCVDGEAERGRAKEVDLPVMPKLFRIGDGRNDFKTRKIIVQGEIYPRQS